MSGVKKILCSFGRIILIFTDILVNHFKIKVNKDEETIDKLSSDII
jgi:hypothetical protein